MTRDQVVDLILSRILRSAGDPDLVPSIILELNMCQQTTLERGLVKPWFMLTIEEVFADSTGWRAPLPTNFIELFEESPAVLYVSESGGVRPLERGGRSDIEWGVQGLNTIAAYDVMEGYLLFSKQFAVQSKFRILYYQSEPLPSGNYGDVAQSTPNRWYVYAPDVLAAHVAPIISGTKLRDEKIQVRLEAYKNEADARMLAETIQRNESAKERFLNSNVFPSIGAARTPTPAGAVGDPTGYNTRIYNMEFNKGDTVNRTFTYSIDGVPVDLTTYSAKLQVSTTYGGGALITLTELSGITLGSSVNNISFTFSSAQTTSLAPGDYVYDLQLTSLLPEVSTPVKGSIHVNPEVTT